ncbi:hypothetical protein PENTCL1PPCAC_29916, partial [Pristionchus entomophagus]
SSWVRPKAEEEQFDLLARVLDLPKESICACPRGLRRFIKKFILGSTNSRGRMEDHLVVLLNDALIVAENAARRRTETHEFDIQYTIPLLGLMVLSHPGVILLEHHQEGLHVILEGKEPMIKMAYDSIRAEAESVNDVVDHLPTSVVRPSKDPRHRVMSQSCGTDTAFVLPTPRHGDEGHLSLDDDDIRKEMQRAAAAAEAKLRRRQRRESRDVRHQEITEIDDDDDLQVADNHGFANAAEKIKERNERAMIDSIFGANATSVREKHQVQFAEDLSMMDNDWDPQIYKIVAFLDFFVVQKYPTTVRRKKWKRMNLQRPSDDSDYSEPEDRDEYEDVIIKHRYEVYHLHECQPFLHPFTADSSLIELCWSHKTYRLEMDTEDARHWLEKIETCIMIAQSIEECRPEEERRDVAVIGSCVVRRGKMSYGTRAPEPVRTHRDSDDAANFASSVQLQNSLGPECNWIVADRRKIIAQAPMMMYDHTGQEVTRRVILLNDRLLIAKPTDFTCSKSHTHDIIKNVDILKANYSHDGDILHIKTNRGRQFLNTKNPYEASDWVPLLQQTAQERREHNIWLMRRAEIYLEQQRRMEKRQMTAGRRRQPQQMEVFPVIEPFVKASDPNLDQEDDDDCIILDEIAEKPNKGAKSTGVLSDSEGDEMREPSPGNRNNDLEDLENQENLQLDLQFSQSTGHLDSPSNPPASTKLDRRQARSPLHEPRRKHPKMRLNFKDLEPRAEEGPRPEIEEATLPINCGAAEPTKSARGASPPPPTHTFAPPIRTSLSDFGGRSASSKSSRGKTPADRERIAMITSAQKRLDIEDKIMSRKRHEGQGSSKEECFTPFPPPDDPYPSVRPSSPVRGTVDQSRFVDSLFEENPDQVPKPPSHSKMLVMDDIEDDSAYYNNDDEDMLEINESDLIIPEDHLANGAATDDVTVPAEDEADDENDCADSESEEEDEVLSEDEFVGEEEEGCDEYEESDEEVEQADDAVQNGSLGCNDNLGTIAVIDESAYINGYTGENDHDEAKTKCVYSKGEAINDPIINIVSEEKENGEKSMTAL